MADLEALAARLAAMIDGLQQHIEARATEIAEPRIVLAEQEADRAVAEVRAAAARQKQRHDDLETELRRQLDAQVKNAERLNREVKDLRAAVRRVDELKPWVNEDRKRFYFAEDVWEALGDCGSTATRYLAAVARGERDGSAHLSAGYREEAK